MTIATSPTPTCRRCLVSREEVARIAATLPELPTAKRDRYERDWGVRRVEADTLSSESLVSAFYEEAVAAYGTGDGKPQRLATWMTGELFRLLYADGEGQDLRQIGEVKIQPAALGGAAQAGGREGDQPQHGQEGAGEHVRHRRRPAGHRPARGA